MVTHRLLVVALAVAYSQAASIQDWDLSNVETDPPPYLVDETYKSTVYTDATKVSTYGGVLWTESDVQSPGMKVVTDGDPVADPESCIMSADPENIGLPKQCNDGFQTSKRAKVFTDNLNGPVDLVYQVDTNEVPSDNTYRFFLKYLNLSGVRIKSFKIQLGTGTGANFALSSKGDGLSFATRDGATVENDDIGSYKDIDLSTFFAFGLFGDADTNTNHINDGYYDPITRGTFSMQVNSEDDIEATTLSDNVADLFTAWIPKSLAPMGYFFDFDDDPATEAALVADFDQDWQTYRLCTDLIMQKLIDSNLLTQLNAAQVHLTHLLP